MKATRRTFLKNCAAAGIVGTVGVAGRVEASAGDVFPGWKPGEMDLHFIYTGSGENMFYSLPDGTSILNDTGDFFRPKDLEHTPLLPSAERVGGEWVATLCVSGLHDGKDHELAVRALEAELGVTAPALGIKIA